MTNLSYNFVSVYNISNWIIKEWVTTTGTREKCFVENPADGKLYFFKESIDKYPYEFWSEIVASKIGQFLGFDVLDYNIGIHKDIVGCICESLIDNNNQELIHGVNILKKEIPGFIVSERPIISFDEIERTLQKYRGFISHFVDMLIFDSIIGNQDRHSENWALIRSLDTTNIQQNKNKVVAYMAELYKKYMLQSKNIPFKKFYQQSLDEMALFDYKFSPIYDSGSSLGREKSEESIVEFLSNQINIKNYIDRGISEIKWQGKKNTNHFELIRFIKTKHRDIVKNSIKRTLDKFSEKDIHHIIFHVDTDLPLKHDRIKLSLQRKELIRLLINTRVENLKNIYFED